MELMQREHMGNAVQIQTIEHLYEGWDPHQYESTNFATNKRCTLNTICCPLNLYHLLLEIIFQIVFIILKEVIRPWDKVIIEYWAS